MKYPHEEHEEKTVKDIVSSFHLPQGAKMMIAEYGDDWAGTPAVWLNVVVDDNVWSKPWLKQHTSKIRAALHQKMINAGIERWPYVEFETSSDWKESQQENGEAE